MSEQAKPLVAAAFLCERIMTEKDGVHTYVRVVDTVGARRHDADTRVLFRLWLAVSLKSGDAYGGKYTVAMRIKGPDEKVTKLGEEIPIVLNGDEHGVNIGVQLDLELKRDGLYMIDVLVDGEVLTRVPFRVRLELLESQDPTNSTESDTHPEP